MSACLFANLSFFICLNVICVFEIAVSDIKTTGLLDDCGHIRDRGMLIGCKTVRAKVQKKKFGGNLKRYP